jgi:hypothetical protein
MRVEPTSGRVIDVKGRLSYKMFTQASRIADLEFYFVK